ncbi:MAG: ribonuclease III [Desulfovibrionaceae bacterium]
MAINSTVEDILAYTFTQQNLLQTALTHSSWANENGTLNHNERQEFLGDAVLELCVSWELFTRFPAAREGSMTRLRSRLVSTTALADLARDLGLEQCLLLGKGEESQGGRHRDTLLSDALEAVLGAVFEDGGFSAAQQVVRHIFSGRWPTSVEHTPHKDFKTQLQEIMQCAYKDRPVYVLLETRGPEHAKEFFVRLTLPNAQVFTASGPSLKRAEQEAAHTALNACQPDRSTVDSPQ